MIIKGFIIVHKRTGESYNNRIYKRKANAEKIIKDNSLYFYEVKAGEMKIK